MGYAIAWGTAAVDAAAGFLADDADGVRALVTRIDALADEPRPFDAVDVGSPDLQRLRHGRYRVLYEIVDAEHRLAVIHLRRID